MKGRTVLVVSNDQLSEHLRTPIADQQSSIVNEMGSGLDIASFSREKLGLRRMLS